MWSVMIFSIETIMIVGQTFSYGCNYIFDSWLDVPLDEQEYQFYSPRYHVGKLVSQRGYHVFYYGVSPNIIELYPGLILVNPGVDVSHTRKTSVDQFFKTVFETCSTRSLDFTGKWFR